MAGPLGVPRSFQGAASSKPFSSKYEDTICPSHPPAPMNGQRSVPEVAVVWFGSRPSAEADKGLQLCSIQPDVRFVKV